MIYDDEKMHIVVEQRVHLPVAKPSDSEEASTEIVESVAAPLIFDPSTAVFKVRIAQSGTLYEPDDSYSKCFESDWRHCLTNDRFQRLISKVCKQKEEIQSLKDAIKNNYVVYIRLHDYFSAKGSVGRNFFMDYNNFFNFCEEINFFDEGKELSDKQERVNMIWLAANFGGIGDEKGTDNILSRPEFLNAMLRLSIEKYFSEGVYGSPSDAVQQLAVDHLQIFVEELDDSNDFRRLRFYNRKCNTVITQHMENIKKIFNVYRNPVGKRISMEDFSTLLTVTRLLSREMGLSKYEMVTAFCLSRFLVIDVVSDHYTHVTLGLADFIEALARVADVIRLPTEDILNHTFGGNIMLWRKSIEVVNEKPTSPRSLHVPVSPRSATAAAGREAHSDNLQLLTPTKFNTEYEEIDERHLADKITLLLQLIYSELRDKKLITNLN